MIDTKGRESRTLKFVTISYIIMTSKFLVAGISLPYVGLQPPMSVTEYGAAAAAILSVWLGREYIKKDA